MVTIPEGLRTVAIAMGRALSLLWSVGSFTAFWTTTGQTPGSRVLRIRVCTSAGEKLGPRVGGCTT